MQKKKYSNEDRSILLFKRSNFKLKAIKRAIYDFRNRLNIEVVDATSTKFIEVRVNRNSQSSSDNTQRLMYDFKLSIQDHQLAIEIEDEYRLIRELIVAQAFQPCQNLKEIIQVAEL